MSSINDYSARKSQLLESSKQIRAKIDKIIDEKSLVEFNAFSFGKNEFYDEDVDGLGVVTGYATVDGFPVYVVAIDGSKLGGGFTSANCKKVLECLDKAERTESAVLYILESKGVQVGEGISVLEGLSSIVSRVNYLRDFVPQIAVISDNTLGQASLIAAACDVVYLLDGKRVSFASPSVILASSKNPSKNLFTVKALDGIRKVAVKDVADVRESLTKFLNLVFGSGYEDTADDLNRAMPSLNEKVTVKDLVKAVFDKDSCLEISSEDGLDVKTYIGRVGGYAVASIFFDGGDAGVELDLNNVLKIKEFALFANSRDLPLISFVNTKGIKASADVSNSYILSEVLNLLNALEGANRLSIVYGKAIGLGYTLFASKNFGNNFTYAFANANISLLDGDAQIAAEFGLLGEDEVSKAREMYADKYDAFNAAKIGCIDNVIEPQFVRQYLISALEMLIR